MKTRLPKYVVTFTLTICLTIFLFGVSLLFGAFQPKNITNTLNRANYYDKMVQDACGKIRDYLYTQGIPDEVIDQIIDEDQMKLDAKSYVTAQLSGKRGSISTDALENKTTRALYQYLNEAGAGDWEILQQGIKEVTANTAAIYRDYLELRMVSYYMQLRDSFFSILLLSLTFSLIMSILLVMVLLKFYKRRCQGVRQISYSVLSATILHLLSVVQLRGRILLTGTDSYAMMMNRLIKRAMVPMYVMAVIGFVTFFALLAYMRQGRRKEG